MSDHLPSYKRTVTVWNKEYEITVYQQSKSVWVAVGDYMGHQIRTEDRSDSSAMTRWREAARFKGN